MSIKKHLFKALSPLLAVTLLAGCGSGESSSIVSPPPASSGNGSVTPAPLEAPDIWAAYPETVTVKLAVPGKIDEWPGDDNVSYTDNIWTKSWLAEFNIKTEILWDADDSTNAYETKLNQAIASNQLPDIILTANYSQFAKLQAADRLAPLDDVLNANNYQFFIDNLYADDVSMEIGRVNGLQYGIPRDAQDYKSREIFIRADWMEELNLADPQTMADVIAIGKAFVDSGKAKYALPLYNKIIDGFGDITAAANSLNAYPRLWFDRGGTLAYGSIQPEMKEVLALYADLYRNKYIDQAFASVDSGALAEQITSGQLGILPSDFWVVTWPLPSLWDASQVDWNIYSVMPYEAGNTNFKIQIPENNGRMVCVNADYKYPEVLMKLLNYAVAKISDPERAETEKYHTLKVGEKNYGVFGMSPLYVIRDNPMTNYNSQTNVTNAIDKKDTTYLVSPHDKTQYENIMPYFDATAAGKVPTSAQWSAYKLFYGENSTFGVYNAMINENKYILSASNNYRSETMVRQWGTLVQLEDQYITEIISGKKALDGFDEFVNSWKDLGGTTILKEMNDWYTSR